MSAYRPCLIVDSDGYRNDVIAQYSYGQSLTFKLYKSDYSTVFDASTWTGEAKFLDDTLSQELSDISVSWTTQASGIGTLAFTNTNRPTTTGYKYIVIQLTKSGQQINFLSQRLLVVEAPDNT